MLEQPPRMITWLFLALIAVFLYWLAGYALETPANILPGLMSLVFLITAATCGIDWFLWKVSRRVDQYFQARAITEKVRLFEQIKGMTPEQIQFMENNSSIVSVIPGTPEPLHMLRLGTIEIPMTFVEEFMRLSTEDQLCPVGSWNEGTRHREYAQLITNRLILIGYATHASGNRSAKWTSGGKAEAMKWMGMEE
jgi:hypothetical protein